MNTIFGFKMYFSKYSRTDMKHEYILHDGISGHKVLTAGLSVLYRDISRKQYIASFGNIRKYRDIGRYRDICTLFFMHDHYSQNL